MKTKATISGGTNQKGSSGPTPASVSTSTGSSTITASGTVITPSVTTRSAAAAGKHSVKHQQHQHQSNDTQAGQTRPSNQQQQQQQQTVVMMDSTETQSQQVQQSTGVGVSPVTTTTTMRTTTRKQIVPVSGPDINQGALDGIDMSGFGVDVDDLTDSSDSDDDEHGDSGNLNLLGSAQDLEMQAQLVTAGPAGVAAAAAIASAKKRKRPHTFETNPSVRKRQQTRILRKLRASIDEYTTRVGQQAVVLITMPGKAFHNFKVFGAQPLENVIRSCKHEIMAELEHAIAQQAPQPPKVDSNRHELPPLVIDGIPTPVEKMTQAQLRAFIPLMLKYSTGRGKPGWGKDSTRPPWWPDELPWANVRSDAREDNDKQKISWTHTLRQIVINCYRFHGREDLLPTFSDSENAKQQQESKFSTSNLPKQILHPSLITSNRGQSQSKHQQHHHHHHHQQQQQQQQHHHHQHHQHHQQQQQQTALFQAAPAAYTSANFVQTINNSDGTVSLIQVDPTNSQIITLPDGTQVRAVRLQTIGAETLSGHTLTELAQGQTIELQAAGTSGNLGAHTTELTAQQITVSDGASIGAEGQIIITGEDGSQNSYPMSSLVSIPVSMYQQLASSGQHVSIVTAGDGTNSQNVIQAVEVQQQGNQSNNNNNNNNNNTNSDQSQFATTSSGPGGQKSSGSSVIFNGNNNNTTST